MSFGSSFNAIQAVSSVRRATVAKGVVHQLYPLVHPMAVTLPFLVVALVLVAVWIDGFAHAVLQGRIAVLLVTLVNVFLRRDDAVERQQIT